MLLEKNTAVFKKNNSRPRLEFFKPVCNLLNLGDFCWTNMEIQYLRVFFWEKKGIQVGSKVEDLIVSVVIFGNPFEKYAQVKLDHETPKIIKNLGTIRNSWNHHLAPWIIKSVLKTRKVTKRCLAKLIADSRHQNITEALLAALIQTDSLTSCGQYNSQNFNNQFCMQKSRFVIWMSRLIL